MYTVCKVFGNSWIYNLPVHSNIFFDRDEQLLTAASRPVFSGTINRGDQAVVYPHVYNLLARAKQSSAFVIGTKVRLSTQ